MTRTCRRVLSCAVLLVGALSAPAAPLLAQNDSRNNQQSEQQLERLRRDQNEILRKAERLRALMDRLLQRYERENKQEQVDLLRAGLQHLDRASMVKDVASIRDDLAANAFSEALRKQQEVVTDIERLLNILLQRRSIENLDEEIQQTAEMAATARELERLQAELRQRTDQATRTDPNETERAIEQLLDNLAREQIAEARANARAAGQRRPFLENALQRVRQLLGQHDRLEQRVATDQAGEREADEQRLFELGALIERARELSTDIRDQGHQRQLGEQTDALAEALQDGDQNAVQQLRDRVQAELQRPPSRNSERLTPAQRQALERWQELRQAFQQAPSGATAGEREQLAELAARAQELARQNQGAARQRNGENAAQLAQDSRRTAEQLDSSDRDQRAGGDPGATERSSAAETGQDADPAAEQQAGDSPAQAIRRAAERLDRAATAARSGDSGQAQQAVQRAMRDLEEARRRQREQNPDAEQLAGQMAAEADAIERQLRNAPAAEDEERQAAQALDRAERGLRDVAETLGDEQPTDERPDSNESLQQSRRELENAERTLQQALQSSAGDRAEQMRAAAERQQQLRQQAQDIQQRMQQAQQQGQMNERQTEAASEQTQRAQQAMQAAEQQLGRGQQSSASQQQQQAAQALQQAQQAIQQNRELGAEQQQAMQQLAREQEELEEQILRLAEEARERKNPEARRALEDAAEAARRAQQAMQQGDQEEALEQQEEARKKLEEAAEQLEEERDRYQDLRQEELLFRMKEELVAFMERQRPITQETLELHKTAEQGGLSRPARRKLNQHAEVEQELAGRLQELIDALLEEGNLVYQTVLKANRDDLLEVAQRLAGRHPDVGSYTTMLQQDIERRTEDLLAALEREQQRREQERQEQQEQEQQQQGENKFNPQRRKLVGLIAELEMLKKLEQDTRRATLELRTLLELRSGDDVTDAEVALLERLAHRHGEITNLFGQIKAGVEETMQAMDADNEESDDGGRGR